MRSVRIGELDVHDVTFRETVDLIVVWATDRTGGYVCTPNADHVVKADRDRPFRAAVNGARLRVPDGMWIVYASRLAGRPLTGTVTGRLLVPALAERLQGSGLPVAFVGGRPGSAAATERALAKRYGDLTTVPAMTPSMGLTIGSGEDAAIVQQLRLSAPAIVFVALGAPKQELWMERHTADLPESVLVGVGAAFDIIAGRYREAPRWMTRVGLEWLLRLAQEPRRLARRYLVDDPWIFVWALRTRLGGGT